MNYDFVHNSIASVDNIQDKTIIKEVMDKVFTGIVENCETKYSAIEKRVLEEMPFSLDAYSIYTTVMEKGKIDESHSFLRPMVSSDKTIESFSWTDVYGNDSTHSEVRLKTVFVEADNIYCESLKRGKKVYNGSIHLNGEKIQCRFMLSPSTKYWDSVERLYSLFIQNEISWRTINIPYINKFFDVCLVDIIGNNPSLTGEDIFSSSDVSVDFGTESEIVKPDVIPVWNVDYHLVTGDDFPVPAINKINYEYEVSLADFGIENGYMVDCMSADITSIRRNYSSIVVVSPQPRNLKWTICRILKKQTSVVEQFTYPVFSNSENKSFANRVSDYYSQRVKTRAELERFFLNYNLSAYVSFDSYRITESKSMGETYSMNPFIKDELRCAGANHLLVLYFKTSNKRHYLNRDIISYLVSQIQLMYPEYECVGVLV